VTEHLLLLFRHRPGMGGDGGVCARLCALSPCTGFTPPTTREKPRSVSGGKRSSPHHASGSKIRFADDRIASYHPGGEITQPAHDNVFSFYEQND
jgi:hypothetical protein